MWKMVWILNIVLRSKKKYKILDTTSRNVKTHKIIKLENNKTIKNSQMRQCRN